jgi:hypothetical protein
MKLPMRALRYAFALVVTVAASQLVACSTPKVCDDPQPLPAGYAEMASVLPKEAVVCKDGPNANAVFLNFASRDVKKLTLETMLHLREAGWALGPTTSADDLSGFVVASRGPKSLQLTINRQNGGPYVGRITGSLFVSGAAAAAK